VTEARVDSTQLISELTAIVGAEYVREQPLRVLGAEVTHEVSPEDGESLGRVLAVLGEHHAAAVVRGGGTHDDLGNALRPVAVSISTRRLEGVEEFDEQDGVIRVRAGTRVAALRAQVDACRWDVALDTAGLSEANDATIGGTLAAAAFGARRLGFGPPRDTVLGLGVVLSTGERTSCGARVVKNVTGYDLQKLYCGSFGSLGVIESAWLRLRPVPERVASLVAPVGGPSDPLGTSLALSVARRPTARCVALLDASSAAELGLPTGGGEAGGTFVQVVEFAGPSSSVDDDVAWTRARCDAVAAPSGVIDAISALSSRRSTGSDGESIVARFAMLPSAVSRCVNELTNERSARGARIVAHPGLGLVYASWSTAEAALDAPSIVRCVANIARGIRARARFERFPLDRREGSGFDVFGTLERGELQLMRALKQKFDPAGVLNPGRPAGHL
jgi:glycolate oxidase FAD binding subunit